MWITLNIIAILMIALWAWYDPKILRLQWKSFGKFILFMAQICLLRFFIFKHFPELYESQTAIANEISLFSLLFVFLEDAVFTLPLLFIDRFIDSKVILYTAIFCSAIIFGSFHAYQGMVGVFIATLYIPFASFRYMKEFGFGTIGACHIAYDVITVLTARYVFS